MWLLLKGNVFQQFKATLQGSCNIAGNKIATLPRRVVVINSANTLNIESISKTENSTKSSIVIASSYEKPRADENRRKLDMILNEISKLYSKLSKKIKPHKQANKVPKSDEHSISLLTS